MQCGKQCLYFLEVANTKETKQGICAIGDSYEPTKAGAKCPLDIQPYTCSNCARFGNDAACMTCLAEDSAYHHGELCSGFIPDGYDKVLQWLIDCKLHHADSVLKQLKQDTDDYVNRINNRNKS